MFMSDSGMKRNAIIYTTLCNIKVQEIKSYIVLFITSHAYNLSGCWRLG